MSVVSDLLHVNGLARLVTNARVSSLNLYLKYSRLAQEAAT